MSTDRKSEIVRELFAAYHRRDREALEDLFSDDFRFTSPYDDRIDKTEYFARCWPQAVNVIKAHVIERVMVEGDEAFVTYQCETTDGVTFRNTEYFRFAADQVCEVQVYFGASYRDGTFIKKA